MGPGFDGGVDYDAASSQCFPHWRLAGMWGDSSGYLPGDEEEEEG